MTGAIKAVRVQDAIDRRRARAIRVTCECGCRFDSSLGRFGCPNCNGDNGPAREWSDVPRWCTADGPFSPDEVGYTLGWRAFEAEVSIADLRSSIGPEFVHGAQRGWDDAGRAAWQGRITVGLEYLIAWVGIARPRS